MGYHLRTGISCCRLSGRLIFLDRQKDRYFGLSDPLEQAMSAMIEGRPLEADRITALIEHGLIVERTGGPDQLAPIAWPVAGRSLLEVTPAPRTVRAMIAPAARQRLARWGIGFAGFDRMIRRLERAKTRLKPGRDADVSRVAEIAERHRSAAIIASALGQCFPNSYALARELISKGVAVDLVLGVKLRPFEAHCWVELDGAIVNDSTDTIAKFAPILVI